MGGELGGLNGGVWRVREGLEIGRLLMDRCVVLRGVGGEGVWRSCMALCL